MAPSALAPLVVTLAALLVPAQAAAIVGGAPAPPGKYPYFAQMLNDGDLACGASLVAPDTVLTAAHCVTEDDDSITPAERLTFAIGRDKLSDDSKGETIPAREIIRHEEYVSNSFDNDVALVRLARPSSQPIVRLADPVTEQELWAPGKPTTVIGRGGTFFPGIGGVNTTDDLHEVEVPRVDDARCDATVGIDPETMVCAGNDAGGADSCSGDSGGPLLVPDADGRFVQMGVVSFGTACALPTQYGVYARVGDTKLGTWVTSRITTTEAVLAAPAGPAPEPAPPSRPADPAPQPAAPASPGPTVTPAGAPRRPACVSRRSLRIIVPRRGAPRRVRSVRVTVDGARARTYRGRPRRVRVSLAGLAAGPHTVRIVQRGAGGTRKVTTRTFRSCAPRA